MSRRRGRRRLFALVLRLAVVGPVAGVCGLRDFTYKGYRCARAARPDGALVPRHVAILLARPRQQRIGPKISDIRVVVGRPEYPEQLGQLLTHPRVESIEHVIVTALAGAR